MAAREWYIQRSARTQAMCIGLTVGVLGGLIGLMLAALGPIITFGAVLGLLAGLYILTDVQAALYGFLVTLILLPFGTLPFKVVITPTLLDMTAGVFIMVYLLQWMTGQRHRLQLTPVHIVIALYTLWLLLSFALGMRHAAPTPNKLRQFAETLLAISMTFILVDLIRDPATLRRVLLAVVLLIGVELAIAIFLYALPDSLSESLLVRLSRIGYPNGGVIRYIEDDPAQAERAIGTSVDPNVLGGTLAVGVTLIGSQIFASKPVLRRRWLTILLFGVAAVALFLTFSRASILGMGAALFFIGILRYRRYLPLLVFGVLLVFLLPQTQLVVQRFVQAFTARTSPLRCAWANTATRFILSASTRSSALALPARRASTSIPMSPACTLLSPTRSGWSGWGSTSA